MNERTTHTTDSSGSNTGNSWMDHPAMNGMDPVKLEAKAEDHWLL